jgi:isopentenyl diphosphate isomerase/L-lactate dehydrogenase-like FMN-dependent dehydrogenase
MKLNRRSAIRNLIGLAAGSPLLAAAQSPPPGFPDNRGGTWFPPTYADDVMGPVNLHEFEPIARQKLHKLAYDFFAGGVEDEVTLRANRESLERVRLVPRVMVDVSSVDPSVELFGRKLDYPIVLAPTGGKNLVIPDADMICARAAAHTKTTYAVSGAPVDKLADEGLELAFWRNTTGQDTRERAQGYARRCEDEGAQGIIVTVDNQYQSNRERNNRNHFDYGYMSTGVPGEREKSEPRSPAVAAMWRAHTPNMTWDYIDWLKSAASLPVILKGILAPEDAALAVQRGADAVVVSNHGARQLDSVVASIDALPGVVGAVGGRIPVLMDGGVRRGTDVIKAIALGARAVLIGRPYVWGLAAFGQVGVQRVIELLRAEFALSLALAGKPNVAAIDRGMIMKSVDRLIG